VHLLRQVSNNHPIQCWQRMKTSDMVGSMNGNELLKKLRKLARERHEQLIILNTRGKGLLKTMLSDLGLTLSDIEGL